MDSRSISKDSFLLEFEFDSDDINEKDIDIEFECDDYFFPYATNSSNVNYLA